MKQLLTISRPLSLLTACLTLVLALSQPSALASEPLTLPQGVEQVTLSKASRSSNT